MVAVPVPPLLRQPQRRCGESPHTLRAWILRLLVVALLVGGALYARRHLLGDNAHPHSRVQRITLVNPQRLRPPPPNEVKARELEARKPEVSVGPMIAPALPGEKPHDDHLGVDADGEGKGDGFGLVAKRGGQDITTLGEGGARAIGSGGAASAPAVQQINYFFYGGQVRQWLQNELAAIPSLRERDYVVIALIWVDARGRIVRSELPQPSGFIDIDSALRKALAEAAGLPEPPSGLPQPMKLRITSRELNAKRG